MWNLVSAHFGDEGVVGEVADEAFAWLPYGDRMDQVLAAHKTTLPRVADTAERFVTVATRADFVDTDLVRTQIARYFFGDAVVIGGQRRNEGAVGDVHFGNQLFDTVDDDDGIKRTEGFVVVQFGSTGHVEDRVWAKICRRVLTRQKE